MNLAKRIILIGKGTILYDGTLTNLKNRYDKKTFRVTQKNKK